MDENATGHCARQEVAGIIANRQLTASIFRIEIDCPGIASDIRPGQFLMIRPQAGYDPLLGRPLAVYDVHADADSRPRSVSMVYQVFGRGTARLSQMKSGEEVRVWGPLGHSFDAEPAADRIWFVAGGIGYTPFLALGKWWLGQSAYGGKSLAAPISRTIDFLYGARSALLLPPLDEFHQAGMNVSLCTDDGGTGHHGRVTDLMSHFSANLADSQPELIVACGPEPMLAAVSRWAGERQMKCLVSLENQMACGFGACFSCVAPIRQPDGSVDLRRVCLEGPIFDAGQVAWH
ncbi:MAG: dihydroorotate dehydrogenase electron transfer subunit [Isosphaeraceae bacterium]